MTSPAQYPLPPAAKLLLIDLGLSVENILRRANLPGDLFARSRVSLSIEEYLGLWRAIAAEADNPELALRIGTGIPIEGFDVPLFAALCSPNMNTALARFAHYKRLLAPLKLRLDVGPKGTLVEIEWVDRALAPPELLASMELVFLVHFARVATRTSVKPLKVYATQLPEHAAYAEFFGVKVTKARTPGLLFSAQDGTRPFLTANDQMWREFEPGLNRRLSELNQGATKSERVHAALLELLPTGTASMDAVCKRLGTSARTLQRHLSDEGDSFQAILNRTREALARHYLQRPELSVSEISFLLGYDDPSSFFRAFGAWTGMTPEQARNAPH